MDTTVEFTHSKLTANIEHWSGWLYIPDADVRIDFRGKSCYKADVVKRLWINALVSSYGKFSSRGNKIAWTGEAVRLGPDGSRYAAMNSWARYCTKYGEKHGSKVKSQFQNMRAPDSQIRRGRSMWTLGGIERSKTETIAGDISANDVQFLRDSGTVVKESDLGDMRLIKLGTRPASQVADIVNDMMEARAERDVSN
ncbi:hypothetical protein [Tsukamurella pseudospumae]|uniref:hypothetical protein n=1 Tax=Tsukamurella pseudospumae TaxID=239498 RepID=UPI001111EC18|nr:hypothetical protein [Tsukamurella pseudospumae]